VRLRRDVVTLNFDLLTQKRNQVISVPSCTSDKSLAKIRQQILEISRKHKTNTWITDGRTLWRTDGQRHGRTTRKHIASAGAYRRRRLKNKSIHRNISWLINPKPKLKSDAGHIILAIKKAVQLNIKIHKVRSKKIWGKVVGCIPAFSTVHLQSCYNRFIFDTKIDVAQSLMVKLLCKEWILWYSLTLNLFLIESDPVSVREPLVLFDVCNTVLEISVAFCQIDLQLVP